MYFVAIVLDLVDNRTKGQSSLQRDALRYRRNVPKGENMINKAPLFNIIPDNFFSPLSSQNRLVYWECLCTLFATMGAQLSFGIVMHQGRSFCTGECPPVMRKVKTRYVAIK